MDINANQLRTIIYVEYGVDKLDSQCQINVQNLHDVRYPLKLKLYKCIRSYLWLFPLFASILNPVLIVVTYTSSVLHQQVEPILPYLSDAGTLPPQAGPFSQLLDTIAILSIITGFIRYKQLKYYIQVKLVPKDLDLARRLNRKNFISLWILTLSCLATFLPGNFRSTEWMIPHTFGAAITFLSMYIYAYFMIYLCKQLAPYGVESKPVSMTVITGIGTLGIVLSGFAGLVSTILVGSKFLDTEFRLHWNSKQEGYYWHVASTAGEWILIYMHSLMMFCFAKRMKMFKDWDKVKFFSP